MEENINSRWITHSSVVEVEKCEMICMIQTSSSAGASDTTVYSGVNDQGEVRLVAHMSAGLTRDIALRYPVVCENGLYIKFGANVTGVLIQTRSLR